MQISIIGNPLASTLHINSFSAYCAVLKMENSMKVSLQSIQPLWKIRNVRSLKHAPHLSMDVSLDLYHYMLCFISSVCWATFQAKNNVKSAPDSSALTPVSH